jgi:hypothetical protein
MGLPLKRKVKKDYLTVCSSRYRFRHILHTPWSIDFMHDVLTNGRKFRKRFNRSYRQRVLNAYLFENLDDVREQTSIWVEEYIHQRLHDALGGLPPVGYRNKN